MTSPSMRDIETLSAYIDDRLPGRKKARLEERLKADIELAAALEELRQNRGLLKRIPQRRAPRNFTLTKKMAGIRPPVPRAVSVLSWASAAAMLLFLFTLGYGLVGQIARPAAAPMAAAAPSFGSGATAAPALAAPATQAPAAPATSAPATNPAGLNPTEQETPTVEAMVMSVPEAVTPNANPIPPASKAVRQASKPINLWLIVWPALAVILGGLALLDVWLNKRAFQQKNANR